MKRQNLLRMLVLLFTATQLGAGRIYAAAGDLYDTENSAQSVFKITPDGTRTLFANALNKADGIAFDRFGNAFVSLNESTGAGSVIKITPTGTKTTFASSLSSPAALAFDSNGFLYVAETGGNNVVRYAPDGTKFVFASALNSPTGLAFDHVGNLFVSEHNSVNDVVKITKTGNRSTFATQVDIPNGLAVDVLDNVYVATSSALGGTLGKVLKFTPAGARTTFASGLMAPYGMSFDATGNLFVVDAVAKTILKFLPTGQQSPFASGLNTPLFVAFEPALSQPLNISTRVRVQTGDNALIGGFIATGTAPKKLLVRAIGPSLANFGVPGALQDTTLEVRAPNGALVASNDNWKTNEQTGQSQQATIQATGLAPGDDRESALMLEVAPGAFTAVIRGKNNTSGVGLVEIYDLNQTADSRLANISTRGFVEAGDNVMIGGFIIGSGNGAAKVVVRAIGPSLGALGVANAMDDPTLQLRNANGAVVDANDDWEVSNHFDSGQEVATAGLAPASNRESALLATLPNGSYTVVVAGYNGGIGVGSVEVFNLR